MMKRIVFSGSRFYSNLDKVTEVLDELMEHAPFVIAHGGANGLDKMVDTLARARGIHLFVCVPLYGTFHPRSAPVIRNDILIAGFEPHIVCAFPLKPKGEGGTWDLIKRAEDYKVEEIRIYKEGT